MKTLLLRVVIPMVLIIMGTKLSAQVPLPPPPTVIPWKSPFLYLVLVAGYGLYKAIKKNRR